jgi:hypothetical protein
MSGTVKIALAAAVVGALAAAVILTRPGPEDQAPAVQRPEPRPPVELPFYPAPIGSEPDGGADSGTVRDIHGPSDVVRSRDDAVKRARAERPRFAPDWANPNTLTFAGLRRYRQEYRKQGDFGQETVRALSGAAVVIKGAVMPIDPLPESGEMPRLWLANPLIVMAGCVFCNPPTMADIVYVTAPKGEPYEADRERLYRSVVIAEAKGRFVLGPHKTPDGVEYMFGLELTEISD